MENSVCEVMKAWRTLCVRQWKHEELCVLGDKSMENSGVR